MINIKRLRASFLLALTTISMALPFAGATQPVYDPVPIGFGTAGNIGNVNSSNPLPVTVTGGGSGTVSVTGTYNVTPPVLIDGQTSGVQMDTGANVKVIPQPNDGIDIGDTTINNAPGAPVPVRLGDGTSQVTIDTTSFDGRSGTSNRVPTNSYLYGDNASGQWDRLRAGLVGVQTSPAGYLNVLPMGRFNNTPLSLSDTNFAPIQMSSSGEVKGLSRIWDGTSTLTINSGAAFDGRSNTRVAIPVDSYDYGFNGTTWDRLEVDSSKNLKTAVQAVAAPTSIGAYQLTVGISAVQLTSLTTLTGVTIKADDDNTDSIYIGSSNGVVTTTGFRLKPGQQIFLSVNNANLAWAISGTASQKIHVIGS